MRIEFKKSCALRVQSFVLLSTVFCPVAQAGDIRIGANVGDIEKLLTELVVSRSEISTQMTPVAVDDQYVYTVNIEHGPDGDIDGVGLHTIVRQGSQQQDGSWQWASELIENRTVYDEYHTAPSVGIDETGRVHVAYNMHNIPWQYQRMSLPHDLSSFQFHGQAVTLAEIERWKFENKTTFPSLGTADIPGTQITYPHFANNRSGQLFVTYRFANKPKRAWAERTLGLGVASYDSTTSTWQAIGSPLTVSSEDYDYDEQAPLQPVPYAAEQGWTGYAPRLMFGPQDELHILSFWREGTPGGILTRPCHLYSVDNATFYSMDGAVASIPLTPGSCGNTGFANSQGFYTLVDTAMDSLGNPVHVVSPVGSPRKLVTYDQASQSWTQSDAPGNATEIFFDASDNLWAITTGPAIFRRSRGAAEWEPIYSESAADNCYPKATLNDDRTVAIVHTQSCDQTTVTIYGIQIGLGDPVPRMVSPLPDDVLQSGTETFVWDGAASEYWLYAGTSPGGQQILDSGSLAGATSLQVAGLPTDGSGIYQIE